jgi:hypothetical protein
MASPSAEVMGEGGGTRRRPEIGDDRNWLVHREGVTREASRGAKEGIMMVLDMAWAYCT